MMDIARKIKNLLELANSNNEYEANLAAQRAEEMMLRYNLTLQEIGKVSEYDDLCLDNLGQSIKSRSRNISLILNEFFFVQTYYTRKFSHIRNGRRVYVNTISIYGKRENVEIAKYVYNYLNKTFLNLWVDFRRDYGTLLGRENSFYTGLMWGLKRKLEKTKSIVQEETGIILVRDPELDNFSKDFKTQRETKSRRDDLALNVGYRQGKSINIRKPIESTSVNQGLAIGG